MAKKNKPQQREFNEPEPTVKQVTPDDMIGSGIARKGADTIAAAKKKRKAILDSL